MRTIIPFIVLPVAMIFSACNPESESEAQSSTSEVPATPSSETVQVAEGIWATDFEQALKKAREQKRPVFVDFTGSDWCPPCIQLKKDVFDTAEFKTFAEENLVLLEIDYPRAGGQSPELRRQNDELQQRFKIEVFPTLVLLDEDGKEQKRHLGYMPGGPKAMISWAK